MKTKSILEFKKGDKGIISKLESNNQRILKKLMSMGIIPGLELVIIQTFPSYVLQVGYTQVAIDKEIAQVIIVDE